MTMIVFGGQGTYRWSLGYKMHIINAHTILKLYVETMLNQARLLRSYLEYRLALLFFSLWWLR